MLDMLGYMQSHYNFLHDIFSHTEMIGYFVCSLLFRRKQSSMYKNDNVCSDIRAHMFCVSEGKKSPIAIYLCLPIALFINVHQSTLYYTLSLLRATKEKNTIVIQTSFYDVHGYVRCNSFVTFDYLLQKV